MIAHTIAVAQQIYCAASAAANGSIAAATIAAAATREGREGLRTPKRGNGSVNKFFQNRAAIGGRPNSNPAFLYD